jgi:hypothetical protein
MLPENSGRMIRLSVSMILLLPWNLKYQFAALRGPAAGRAVEDGFCVRCDEQARAQMRLRKQAAQLGFQLLPIASTGQ